jgi:pyruvate,water dikinase
MTDVLTYEGIGACTGEATGIARLPNDPLFKEGDILIASMTTPDNVPAMKLAGGIATDRGSITCHAAIVARELNKPCVVRTGSATSAEGKTVTIRVTGIKDALITWTV